MGYIETILINDVCEAGFTYFYFVDDISQIFKFHGDHNGPRDVFPGGRIDGARRRTDDPASRP